MKRTLLGTCVALAVLAVAACSNEAPNHAQTTANATPAHPPASKEHKAPSASAKEADDTIKARITQSLRDAYQAPELKVTISNTPVQGLHEVVLPNKAIIYTTSDANYVIAGDMLDLRNRRNLTAERTAELRTVDYSTLPFDKSLKIVKGDGKRKIAVFSDPDCPYCQALEKELEKVTNVTIHTFLMPIPSLHPDAVRRAKNIWCAKDPAKAWTDWMINRKEPPKAPASCKDPVQDIIELGEKLGFDGTPTLVFPNGRVHSGLLRGEALEKALDESQV